MIIDTHAHLNFKDFRQDLDEILQRAKEAGVVKVINVGSQLSTSERAVEMAQKYSECYAAIGLHPIHLEHVEVEEEGSKFISRAEEFDYEIYKKLASNLKVVAIGECGLDFFHIPHELDQEKVIQKQKEVFKQHIELARELNLPLILHCRGVKENPDQAYREMLEVLDEEKYFKGVIHCFGASLAIAQEFIKRGFYVGFTGVVTFKNAKELQNVAREIPLNRILIETDCPYLAPEPHRGQRNEPAYVVEVGKKIAELKNLEFSEVDKQIEKNTFELFNL